MCPSAGRRDAQSCLLTWHSASQEVTFIRRRWQEEDVGSLSKSSQSLEFNRVRIYVYEILLAKFVSE